MLYAADFRAHARTSLSGKWLLAVVAGLIASLLGGSSLEGPELHIDITDHRAAVSIDYLDQTLFSTTDAIPHSLLNWILANAALIVVAAIAYAVVIMLIGSSVSVGYAKFNLRIVDGFEAELGHLLSCFSRFKTNFCAHFLMGLYIMLWSLLLAIPGIIASYSYAMTDYILAEHPDMTASQAIDASKDMMEGNRWRLFCLEFSFIGWNILCLFTFGLGNLWLTPYKKAAFAAFYRSLR